MGELLFIAHLSSMQIKSRQYPSKIQNRKQDDIMSLKPWYKVITPREDLREGKPLDASEFGNFGDVVDYVE